MTTTATVFFCGSGNNMSVYKTEKFIVPALIKNATGIHMGFNGVGGNKNSHKAYERDEKGNFKLNDNDEKKIIDPQSHRVDPKKRKWKTSGGATTGSGTNSIAIQALNWLGRASDDNWLTDINLCGHSRGAVTATMVAWAIQNCLLSSYTAIKVNVFLFDPVAGGFNEFDSFKKYKGIKINGDRHELPNIVKNFEAIVSSDLSGKPGFGSTVPADHGNCRHYKVYQFPGDHNTATKFNMTNGGSVMGVLGAHLAQKFLERHGSTFNHDFKVDDKTIVENYSEIRAPFKKFNDTGKVQKKKKVYNTGGRQNVVEKYNQNLKHPYFVNNHHEEVFERKFNAAYCQLRMQNMIQSGTLNNLRNVAPHTADVLDTLKLEMAKAEYHLKPKVNVY